MAKIYFVRHQAGGVLWEHPCAETPTQAQMIALGAMCEALHGETHPKTDEPYWLTWIAVDVLGPTDIPSFPESPGETANVGAMAPVTVAAVGHVSNPKEGI
jgi:hypothetical protein